MWNTGKNTTSPFLCQEVGGGKAQQESFSSRWYEEEAEYKRVSRWWGITIKEAGERLQEIWRIFDQR